MAFGFPRFSPSISEALVLGGLAFGIALGLAGPATAQGQVQTDTVKAADVAIRARFGAAQALAVDPAGRLYVADARSSTVVVLTAQGQVQRTVGGSGTRVGLFDGPADVDPTNGLSLWVADAGNGRLQHFSQNLRFLESVPVGRVDPASGPRSRQPVFDVGRDGTDVRAEGEPVAVASTSANELFALDARESVVVKWDAQRRLERVIGGFGQRAGALRRPVSLAILNTQLFVGDAAQNAVLVFDRFGTYQTTLRPAPLADVQAMSTHDGRLWIVTSRRIHVTTPGGTLQRTIEVDADEPLVDAVPHPNGLFVLTATRLLHRPVRPKPQR